MYSPVPLNKFINLKNEFRTNSMIFIRLLTFKAQITPTGIPIRAPEIPANSPIKIKTKLIYPGRNRVDSKITVYIGRCPYVKSYHQYINKFQRFTRSFADDCPLNLIILRTYCKRNKRQQQSKYKSSCHIKKFFTLTDCKFNY